MHWLLLLLVTPIYALTTTIEYNLVHSNTYMFSTGLNSSYVIHRYENLQTCKQFCDTDTTCLGISEVFLNNTQYCNLLSNLGDTITTTYNIKSYMKYTRYFSFDKHTIYGRVLTANDDNTLIDTKIYIDLNRNRQFDNNEPYTMSRNGSFKLSNISSGNYIIREDIPKQCTQLYPGPRNPYYIDSNLKGGGFVDKIVYLHSHQNFNGDNITNQSNIINSKFITGNNSNTYLSLVPNDELVVSFIDETITNKDGDDIFITTYNNSSTSAHVRVSTDGINYIYIGILNNTHKSFDMNTTSPINYIKFHFFGEDRDNSLNIASIYGNVDYLYKPSFGYYIKVPLDKYILFINDCHFKYSCFIHCLFRNVGYNNYMSCYSGCKLFNKLYNCDCNLHKKNTNSSFLNIEKCNQGCEYRRNQFFYPDYKVYTNSRGHDDSIINLIDLNYCNPKKTLAKHYCLDNIKAICTRKQSCKSISINDKNIINYNSVTRIHEPNSVLIVKKTHIGANGLPYLTQSTTITSTPTTNILDTTTSTNLTSTSTVTSTNLTSTSTVTSTNLTSTSTVTSTNLTSTSTVTYTNLTSTSTVTSTNLTSNNMNETTSDPISDSNKSSSSNQFDNTVIIYLSCSILILVLVVGITTLYYKLQEQKKKLNDAIRTSSSFENPVYEKNDGLYDKPSNDEYITLEN